MPTDKIYYLFSIVFPIKYNYNYNPIKKKLLIIQITSIFCFSSFNISVNDKLVHPKCAIYNLFFAQQFI